MNELLSEIRNFRRFSKLNESFGNINTVMFGDELIFFLFDKDIKIINNLTEKNINIYDLVERLEFLDSDSSVDHVFFSIGTDDDFEKRQFITPLCNTLKNKFPEANIYVIRAILENDYFLSKEDDKVIENLELKIDEYYDDFVNNGVDVIGSYNSVEYGLGITKEKLNTLKNEIAKKIMTDVSSLDKQKTEKEDKPFISPSNVEISGDDETDFDTIYEFLDRFQKMVKSKNEYSRRTNTSFKLDIEQIQIALVFLIKVDLEINGIYDLETENAISEYQDKKGIEQTGICDHDTLEDMFYDLKIQGFDDDDLSIFLKLLGIDFEKEKKERKKFTGTVDSVWKMFTDKIIDKFEGGYWNRDRTKPISEKCINHPYEEGFSDNSGETMFGIDRRAGNWDSTSEGREYFGLIDDEKEEAGNMVEFCKKWYYNYRGGPLEEELKLRASALMKTSFDRNKSYLNSETLKEVQGNKRLLFHFAYACWNGSGFFQDFANEMDDAYAAGKRGDELVDVAVEGRNRRFGSGSWSKANRNVVNTIKNDPDLEN